MANTLTDLETKEVSLVDRGAVKRKFALRKAEDTMHDEVIKACLETPLDNESDVDTAIEKAGVDARSSAAIKGAIRLLNAFKDSLTPANVKMISELAGYGDQAEDGDSATQPTEKSETVKPETNQEEPNMSSDKAAGSEDVQKQFALNQEAIAKAQSENVELRKALDVERDARITRECIEKAGKEFPMVGSSADVAEVLKALSGNPICEKVEAIFKAANERIAKGQLTREIGKSGRSQTSTIEQKVNAMVAEIRKADPTKSAVDARNQVWLENDSLYREYLSEQRAAS